MTMRKRNALAGAVGAAGCGLALLVGSGCRTTPTVKPAPAVTVYRADGGTDISHDILFVNSRLAHDLRISDVRKRTTDHGLLNPSVTAVSTYGGSLNFEYRFCWFDASGYEIGAETSSWKPVTLQKNEAKTVESVAPSGEVKEFRLKLRSR
jgi:uncharacterized protein YcfL